MKRRPTWRVLGLILLMTLQSCGGNKEGASRCKTKEEARTQCLAEYIADGFTLDQAKVRCDPLFTVDSCY
jgi:hypothetical protein